MFACHAGLEIPCRPDVNALQASGSDAAATHERPDRNGAAKLSTVFAACRTLSRCEPACGTNRPNACGSGRPSSRGFDRILSDFPPHARHHHHCDAGGGPLPRAGYRLGSTSKIASSEILSKLEGKSKARLAKKRQHGRERSAIRRFKEDASNFRVARKR